jgi:hypothetical protein
VGEMLTRKTKATDEETGVGCPLWIGSAGRARRRAPAVISLHGVAPCHLALRRRADMDDGGSVHDTLGPPPPLDASGRGRRQGSRLLETRCGDMGSG